MRRNWMAGLKRPDIDTALLGRLYTKDHLTLRQIAAKVGMSATAVHARLTRIGVTAREGEWITRRCAYCGEPVQRPRSRSRGKLRVFCNDEHYYALLAASGFVEWRHGSRLARAVVAQHFALQPEHVVHHKDDDQRHNDLANLAVYASNADHMAHHRGRKVAVIWDGASSLG